LSFIQTVARMPAQWRLRLLQFLARIGVREDMLLVGIAAIIGVGAGAAAWLFERALHLMREFYFLPFTQGAHATTSNLFLLPLIPAIGGLLVVVVRRLFRVPHSKMHGVSAILYSLIRKASSLRPLMGLETFLASSMTIGTGGSAGPEAPIAVIGSSIGSLIGTAAGISRRNLPTLIGCGAAAGISAVFDAPIAGVLFALEVLLRDFSVRTFSPIVISAVVATVMYQTISGQTGHGLFANSVAGMPYQFTFQQMPHYLVLGLICGALAVLLTKMMSMVEHQTDRIAPKIPRSLHPALGALLSGVCGVVLILAFRHDAYLGSATGQFATQSYVPIFADGYPTIHRALDPAWYTERILPSGNAAVLTLAFLATVCILKIIATSFTLGAGGSGGVFAPSLFIGATGGGAVGMLMHQVDKTVAPYAFALVGMGAVLAAAIQAPLMSIILLFELTRNYQVMLPAMLAAVTATAIQQWVMKDSLYTLPLRLEGVRVGLPVGAAALRRIGVDQLELDPARAVSASTLVTELIPPPGETHEIDCVVMDDKGNYLGIVTLTDMRLVELQPDAAMLLVVGEVVRTDAPPMSLADSAERALELFSKSDYDFLPVFNESPYTTKNLKGVLSRASLMKRYHLELSGG
jgi:CIC family chloride channel protein